MAVLKQDKDSASEQKVEAQSEQAGKGRPTPKRKEAQAQKLGEFFIPVALVILVASVILTAVYPNPVVTLILMTVLYVYLFAIVIDVVVMWRKLKKLLIAKYGEQSVAKGMRTGSYAWSRAIQLRRWRLPKPRYKKRGHWPK